MKKIVLFCLIAFFCPHGDAASRVDEMFDPRDFSERPKISKVFWSNKSHHLYGKSVFDWIEEDFKALEKQLATQLDLEREIAESKLAEQGLSSVQEDPIYLAHKTNLENSIQALPEIRRWIAAARYELQQQERTGDGTAESVRQTGTVPPTGNSATSGVRKSANPPHARSGRLYERERLALEKKQRTRWIVAAVLAGLIVMVAALFWILSEPRVSRCPRCKTTDKTMLVVGGRSGRFSFFRIRRKCYCKACGYKWLAGRHRQNRTAYRLPIY